MIASVHSVQQPINAQIKNTQSNGWVKWVMMRSWSRLLLWFKAGESHCCLEIFCSGREFRHFHRIHVWAAQTSTFKVGKKVNSGLCEIYEMVEWMGQGAPGTGPPHTHTSPQILESILLLTKIEKWTIQLWLSITTITKAIFWIAYQLLILKTVLNMSVWSFWNSLQLCCSYLLPSVQNVLAPPLARSVSSINRFLK